MHTRRQQRAATVRVRNTRQRAAIASAVLAASRPLTAHEVLEEARSQSAGLGIATVYRTLAALEAEGAIAAVQLPNDSPRYEPKLLREHHYFHCRQCLRAFWVFGSTPEIERMTPAQCTVERSLVLLFGYCAACRVSLAERT